MSSEPVFVKAELEWAGEENQEDNKSTNSLYADHEVKPDLVIGPETVQLPNVMIEVEIKSEPVQWSRDPDSTEQPDELPAQQLVKNKAEKCSKQQIGPVCIKEMDKDSMQKNIHRHDKKESDFKTSLDINEDKKRLEETCYPCEKCSRTFLKRRSLTNHLRTHSTDTYCKICPKKSRLTCNNPEHNKVPVMQNGVYPCEYCHKKFSIRWRLNEHMQIHLKQKSYRCEICGKAFLRPYNYNVHLRTHSDVKPYSCDICHKSFREKGNLTCHYLIHTENKPHICEICKKGFKLRSDLNKHLQTHREDKEFSCDICKKMFQCKRYLIDHLKMHFGDKTFACDVCNKAFLFKRHLVRHYRVHTGLKPYYCDLCNRGYTKKYLLISHIQSHDIEVPVVE